MLTNPTWTDAADVDDFNVTSSAVVKKAASQGASISIDVKYEASYSVGATQSTSTSYVRYSRFDDKKPGTGSEWNATNIDNLVVAVECIDCSPNNRVTQIQAKVDAKYNPEYALEVRFGWSGLPTAADSWLLIVECTQLDPGAEGVLVQVGQGGGSPTNWRTAYTCASANDTAAPVLPLSYAELNNGAPVVRIWDNQADTPDDMVRGTTAFDVLRIDVGPDGSVNSTFEQPLNYTTAYANNTLSPFFVEDNVSYTYATSFGNYTFLKSSPYIMSVRDLEGRQMADASSFVVEGNVPSNLAGSFTVLATNTTFVTTYTIQSGAVTQGVVTFSAVFNATVPPKLSASFAQNPGSTFTTWHIRWKIESTAMYLRNPGETTTYYGSYQSPQIIGDSPTSIAPVASIGPDPDATLWNSTLTANWSDMGVATLYAGPVSIDSNYSGSGLMVAFPNMVATVDPSLVAQSYTSLATRFSVQKKVFFHDGRYFAFYYFLNGITPSIRYSAGRETYSTGQGGGMIWNAPIVAVVGPFHAGYGFDVDQRDGVVGLTWFDSASILKFMKGTVRGDVIAWQSAVSVDVAEFSERYAPVAAVGHDGFFWVAVAGRPSGSLKGIYVYRSSAPEGTSFAWTLFPILDDVRVALRLVPFPGGTMMLLASSYLATEVTWRTWDPLIGQWSSALNTVGLGLKANVDKTTRLTAVGIVDEGGGIITRAAYIDASNRLKAVRIYPACPPCHDVPIEIDPGPASYPALLSDLNNDVHFFWTEQPCATCSIRIYYRWETLYTISPTFSPFAPVGSPAHLASGYGAQSQRAFIAYTDYPGGAVYFGSVPTRRGAAGTSDAAWQRPGVGPQGLYFQQLSESVSVGTGLLYVKQTDLSIPGRGLDLSIQRLYRTPDAFSGGSPWGYEQPSMYPVGNGWSFNFPWITQNHLYLWDGQEFLIRWDDNVFENRNGEYFRLERDFAIWYLYTKSGVKFEFRPGIGQFGVTSITDLNGNMIQFSYSWIGGGYRLSAITDTMGRVAAFSYTPTPNCTGSGGTPPRVCAVTYGGRTVEYRYAGNALSAVVDPGGRTTSYVYCVFSTDCNGVTEPWLLAATVYTTGARTIYRYRSVHVGTDATSWVVSTQKVQDVDGVTTIRKRTYEYDFLNGALVFAKVTSFAGEVLGTVQGYTLHNLDPLTGSATTTQLAASNAKLDQQRMWYGEEGRVAVVDAFKGALAADSNAVTYSTYTHYDVWGNLVYARDPEGKEAYYSYLHSNNQSAFYAPGRLEVDPNNPGMVWIENFRDRDITYWGKSVTYGVVKLDSLMFGVLPPSLQVKTTVANGCCNAIAWHTFAGQSAGHVANALVRLEESNQDHLIQLQSGSTVRVQLNFAANGKLKYSDGGLVIDGPSYTAGRWYRVTIRPTSGSAYNLHLDGVAVRTGSAMLNSGPVDTIWFRAGSNGVLAGMWVNEIHVFKGDTVAINGIQYGSRVRVLSPTTGKALIADRMVQGGSVILTLSLTAFPGMVIQVLDREWSPIYTSPSREFWGGAVLDFVEPQFLKSGLTKVSSGFLRFAGTWLDDRPLPGAVTSDGEGWTWKMDGSQVSGSEYHVSPEKQDRHGHGFREAATPLCVGSGNEYHIQYVYLRPDAFPAEILRAFESFGIGDDWNHRAFWGADADGLGGIWGTDARRYMGSIPLAPNRWLMLIVKHDDIANYAAVSCFEGASYYAVSGGLNWDLTAKGDVATGQIKVRGLQQGQTVSLVSPPNHVMSGEALADPNGIATLDVYATGSSFRNAFPATGQFRIHQSIGGTIIYKSPWFANIFGGDEYVFSGSDFYSGGSVTSYAKDRLAGTYRILGTDDATGGPLVQESHHNYDVKANLIETKVRAPGGTWTYAYRTYDAYGNAQTAGAWVTDTLYHETSYSYDPSHQSAYLTTVSDAGFGSTALTYNSNTGELSSVTPPKIPAQTTGYLYDAVGRLTRVTHPGGKFVQYEYFDSGRLVVVKDEMYDETSNPVRKRQTWQCYDAVGRLTGFLRFGDSGPLTSPSCTGLSMSGYYSWEKYSYNWQDQVTAYTDATGRRHEKTYDSLGRVTRVTNPDLVSWVDVAYDDATNTKTVSVTTDVQSTRKTVYLYDRNNRLTEVREFWGAGANDYYPTNYAYDNVGDIVEVLTPQDGLNLRQRTNHSYDAVGRLRWTSFPDGTHEEYQYFPSGLLKQKRDRSGTLTTYTYDDLRRVNVVTYPDGSSADYDYEPNGNLLRLMYTRPGPVIVTLDYSYDTRDRLKTETSTVDGIARTVTYDYDDASSVVRIQGPAGSGYDVYYAYDAFNRACAVSSISISTCTPGTYYAKLSYYADDALDTITYETGATDVTTKYAYNTNGWPLSIETKKGSTTHLRLDYEDYDALGNPVRIKHTGGVTTTYECFTYDALNRLIASNTATASTCAFASGAWSWNLGYQYDAVGNRKVVTDGGATTYYKYDTYSRLCRTKAGGQPSSCTDNSGTDQYTYNSKGEMTSRVLGGTAWAFLWGPEGRLASMCRPDCTSPTYRSDYTHDGLGRRVKSVIGPASPITNVYVYSGLSVIYETNPATKYVFANGLRLAKIGASTEYYHYDHLGNVRLVTNGANGNVASILAYRPFGLAVVVSGSEPKYGYTGEYRETTPNLIYLHSRWYDPVIGRFLSPDNRLGSLGVPQDQNRYTYVMNNPLVSTDPTGHFPFVLLFIFLWFVLFSAWASWASYKIGCFHDNSCTTQGEAAAIFGGALAGAIGFWAPGFWSGIALGALANFVAYASVALATGTFTLEGALVAGIMGGLLAGLGYGIGKAVQRLIKPSMGAVTPAASKAAAVGDDVTRAGRGLADVNPSVDEFLPDPYYSPVSKRYIQNHPLKPRTMGRTEWLDEVSRVANKPDWKETVGEITFAYGKIPTSSGTLHIVVRVEGEIIADVAEVPSWTYRTPTPLPRWLR